MADWRWSGGVYVRYYVLHWFYAEVYHILELSCIKQVEPAAAPAVQFIPDQEQTSRPGIPERDCWGDTLLRYTLYT